MVKIFYLRDTFEASELDTDKWSQTNGVVQLGGAARMPLGNTYSTLESVRSYELRQSEVVSHITAFGAGETRELTMSCRIDASNERRRAAACSQRDRDERAHYSTSLR